MSRDASDQPDSCHRPAHLQPDNPSLLLCQPTLKQLSLTLLPSQNCKPVSTLKHKVFYSTGFTLSIGPTNPRTYCTSTQLFVPETPHSWTARDGRNVDPDRSAQNDCFPLRVIFSDNVQPLQWGPRDTLGMPGYGVSDFINLKKRGIYFNETYVQIFVFELNKPIRCHVRITRLRHQSVSPSKRRGCWHGLCDAYLQ